MMCPFDVEPRLRGSEVDRVRGEFAAWVRLEFPSCKFLFTGSTEMLGEGNDVDCVVLLPEGGAGLEVSGLVPALVSRGWECTSDMEKYDNAGTAVLRAGLWNLILETDPERFATWEVALSICKAVIKSTGLCDRDLRVAIHKEVRSMLSC